MISVLIVDKIESPRKALYNKVFSKSFSVSYAGDTANAYLQFKSLNPILIIVVVDTDQAKSIKFCQKISTEANSHKRKVLLLGDDLDEKILGRDTAKKMGADDLAKLPIDAKRLGLKLKTLLTELSKASKKQLVAKQPVTKQPVTKQPVTKQPVTKQPVTKQPVAKQAAVKQPTAKPITDITEIVGSADENTVTKMLGKVSDHDYELVDNERVKQIVALRAKLESLNYYQLLSLSRDTNPGIVRKQYFKLTKLYHPDRFAIIENTALKQAVSAIFKVLSEAYQVLCNSADKQMYDEVLAKNSGFRLVKKDRTHEGPKQSGGEIENPNAKKFYKLALTAISAGNYSSAKMNLTLALNLAPEDQTIISKIKEIESLMA